MVIRRFCAEAEMCFITVAICKTELINAIFQFHAAKALRVKQNAVHTDL